MKIYHRFIAFFAVIIAAFLISVNVSCARPGVTVVSAANRPLFIANFTADAAGAITNANLHGLTLTRASAGYTVQTGTSTMITGLSNTDEGRIGRPDEGSLGLVLEEARTNYFYYCHYGTLNMDFLGTNGITSTGYTAPDGSTTATYIEANSGSYSKGLHPSGLTIGTTYTGSEWFRAPNTGYNSNTGDGFTQLNMNNGALTSGVAVVSNTSSYMRTWGSITLTVTNPYFIPVESRSLASMSPGGGEAARRHALVVDYIQWERGAFPTEAITNNGTVAGITRAGERLYLASASSVIRNGRLAINVRIRPKGRHGYGGLYDYSAPMRLWTSGSDYAEIGNAANTVTVSIGGQTNVMSISGCDWTLWDTVEIFLATGGGLPTQLYWRSDGAYSGNAISKFTSFITGLGTTQNALGNITSSGSLDILTNGTSNQFSGWITSVSFWPFNGSPGWTH